MPTTLVPGRLTALGGLIPLDDRVSWVPPGSAGFQPSNCYLLSEPDGALLVDTGLAVHSEQVLAGLAECLGADAAVSIFFTRGEMDCVSNLEPISRRFDITRLFTGGVVNPFDAFDDVHRLQYAGRRQQIDQRSEGGDSMPRSPHIEIAGERSLKIESPLLRLLPTFWGWDNQTGALFTSDVFTHGTVAKADDSRVIDSRTEDRTTVDDVTGHLLAKYEWLRKATTEPLREWLSAKFQELRPEIIAPARGRVLQGRDVVERHLNLMLQALGSVGA
ncbi:hypothetical protein [Streptomyces sp. NPDC056821]|uniref:hypothetical protein n=1 Tax=unclassified Streptomyces TaxID=2593676 RepID=UPI0036C4FF91